MDDDMISLGLNCGERECVECIHVDLCRFVHVKKDEPCAFRKTAVDPVRHGRWIPIVNTWTQDEHEYGSTVYKCDQCGRTSNTKQPYCHCGAKMAGEGGQDG